jgi:hypothetical protein
MTPHRFIASEKEDNPEASVLEHCDSPRAELWWTDKRLQASFWKARDRTQVKVIRSARESKVRHAFTMRPALLPPNPDGDLKKREEMKETMGWYPFYEALVQGVETARAVLTTTPQGQAADAQFVKWLMEHQKEAGEFTTVSCLVEQLTDNPAARMTAQEIAQRVQQAQRQAARATAEAA